MVWVTFAGPNGEAVYVRKDAVAGMIDATVGTGQALTTLYLSGGPGFISVQGRPAEVLAAIEAAG